MAKQSIISRTLGVFRSQAHNTLDKLEDPKKAMEQTIRDMGNDLNKVTTAVAQTIGELRMMEQDRLADIEKYKKLQERAVKASAAAEKAILAGDEEGAAKWEAMLEEIVNDQTELEAEIRANSETIAQMEVTVEALKKRRKDFARNVEEAERKKNQLVTQDTLNGASKTANKALAGLNGTDITSTFARVEAKIRADSAEVTGFAELESLAPESKYAELDALDKKEQVHTRLAALRAKVDETPSFLQVEAKKTEG